MDLKKKGAHFCVLSFQSFLGCPPSVCNQSAGELLKLSYAFLMLK